MSQVLDLVGLLPLMQRTSGGSDIRVGLIDGPVATAHADLAAARIEHLLTQTVSDEDSAACAHGTFVAGILCAARSSAAPAICPGCTVLARPIFAGAVARGETPRASPAELAQAILDCVGAGARLINISAAIIQPTVESARVLKDALDEAARRGVIVVAAAGNQGSVGATPLTSHPWVIPVAACDGRGRPAGYSNLGQSIGRRGLAAPGDQITSLGTAGSSVSLSGTSAAAPFVTGALALLWSEFPRATASLVRLAATRAGGARRAAVFPPLLNAWAAHQAMRG